MIYDEPSCARCGNLEGRLDDALARADKAENEVAKLKQVGATGQFPHGRVGPDDLGELKSTCYVRNGKLILDFGKELSWLAMTKGEVMAMVAGLYKMAEKLPG